MQCSHRPDHNSPTISDGLGATHGHAKKDRAHNHLRSWPPVRGPRYAFMFRKADLYAHSVCLVTIIRIIFSAQLNVDDYTYDIAKISIVTTLEPLLGIIAACLPLCRPTLRKATGHMKKTSPETRDALSSSMARLRLKRSKVSTFQRSDDCFPLTDLEDNRTHNHITGPSNKPDSLVSICSRHAGAGIPLQCSIKIQKTWEIRSDEPKQLGAKL